MQTGIELSQLAVELDRQRHAKRDYIAPSELISLEAVQRANANALDLVLDGHGRYSVNPTARSQIQQITGIPAVYFNRLQESAPGLLEHNVNHWLHEDESKRLVRTLDDRARALLSPQYRALDNYDLAEAVLPAIAQLRGIEIRSCNVSDDYLYIQAVSHIVKADVAVGDTVALGFTVRNSEVGRGRLAISRWLLRLVCLNGLKAKDVLAKAHLGRSVAGDFDGIQKYLRDETRELADRAFFEATRDCVAGILSQDALEEEIEPLRIAAGTKIEAHPAKAIAVVAQEVGLTKKEESGALQHLIEGGDLSQWGFVNAITRLAHDAESYDRNIELQEAGQKVVQLKKRSWEEAAEKVKLN